MAFATEQIKSTLLTILYTQDHVFAANILEAARLDFLLTSSDYGVDFYSLDLRIPPALFARHEHELDNAQELIASKLFKLGIHDGDGDITQVRIFPEYSIGAGAVAAPTPTKSDENRIWSAGRVRLFLSHVTRIRADVSGIKNALAVYGIDSFVAHEDIEPTVAWHREIEFALRSADMLCAFITPDFINSKWTDQEVGFALGRPIPVIAVRCGADPYGLLGKDQALTVDIAKPAESAVRIADIIARQEHLKPRVMEGLVESFANANSYQDAKDSSKLVLAMRANLTEPQIVRLLEAVRDNSQVREATGVPARIELIAVERKVSRPSSKKRTDDFDDDIPF